MSYRAAFLRIGQFLHGLALLALVALALTALGITILSAMEAIPWLTLTATFGEVAFPQAGPAVQIGLTAILVALMFFVPGNLRMLALERSHRNFRVSMEDVARAYHICHTADRAGLFTLSSEFDAVRERIAHLRDHPDLGLLESDILTLAAQMSQQSRHLAEIYSDEKVARARDFLAERQKEAEAQQARIVEALHVVREIRRWADQVEVEEAIVASQLSRLDEQLQTVLPALGYGFEDAAAPDSNVVPLKAPSPAAE